MKLSDWLKKNRDILKIGNLETKAGVPRDTVQKFMQGERDIPERHQSKIKEFLHKLRDSINEIKFFNV